ERADRAAGELEDRAVGDGALDRQIGQGELEGGTLRHPAGDVEVGVGGEGEREAARGGREEIGGVPAYDLLVLRPTQVGVRSAHGERGNTEKKQEKSRHSRAPSA